MKSVARTLLILGLLFWATTDFAWNDSGHMTVAELAWRNLSATKRKAISKLLQQHPHFALLLATNMPAKVDTNEWVFLKAATWPDMVRPNALHPKPVEITKYHHGDWHYLNVPYIWPTNADHLFASNFPPPVPNVLIALTNAIQTLQTPDAAPADRAVSLCWVLHLIGDLHQPLHATAMFSDDYSRGDEGGNLLAVREAGNKPVKLHGFWDELLGTGVSYHFIETLADTISAAPQNDPTKSRDYKKHKTLELWIDESVGAAEAFAYQEGQLPFADWSKYNSHKITADDVPTLDATYLTNARDVARRRIAFAGRRLSDTLKKLF